MHKNKLRTTSVVLGLCLAVFLVVTAEAKQAKLLELSTNKKVEDYYQVLTPLKSHSRVNREIIRMLEKRHYLEIVIDDQASQKFFNRYLSDLDPSRSYFLSADIASFKIYENYLDDALLTGDLKAGFTIFNTYQKRVVERYLFALHLIENGLEKLDFTREETIAIDREDAPWPKNTAELDDLWRKRIKNTVLTMELNDEPLKEIQNKLKRRYLSRLNRISQNQSEDAFWIYMNAYTQTIDPHTQYLSPRVTENFNIHMSLSLEGIGALLQTEDEYTKVIRLIPGGPAEKSKLLKPGDRIVGVGQGTGTGDMVDVIGWRIGDVVELIRGPKETVVRLEVIPADAESELMTRTISITRNKVNLEEQSAQKKLLSLESHGKTHHVGVIEIPTFYLDFQAIHSGKTDYRSTSKDVEKLIHELRKESIEGLVVDLRDNGGGALQEVNQLVGQFIKTGPTVLVKGGNGNITEFRDTDPSVVYEGPLVVLVDRLSASASEIFAGAIQDYHRGIILGSQTFGKGTVQGLKRLERGQLKLTQAKFYRISGMSTQHKGVFPDIQFPTLYDTQEIGEDMLPNAMPWDKIDPVDYTSLADIAQWIPKLKASHQKRITTSPDFIHLMEGIERLNASKAKKVLSLNEVKRKKERKEIEQKRFISENKRRKAKNLSPYESFEAMETSLKEEEKKKEENPSQTPDAADDPFLIESAQILIDYVQMAYGK